ncbi:3454_t:CDS:2 [Acaulospora morrowiae]|uniref:3454_t:CDS:1 n=1 Tax=Acaulospora morrowiae TaxID=94023 RepID=A0A9N8VY64_9GLOM|nr:3454_t:CDS:2 [Acaulospora morrowiae]
MQSELEAEKIQKRAPRLEQITEENTGLKIELRTCIRNRQHSSTQSESSTESETSTASLPQYIVGNDSAEILDFIKAIHKEWIGNENLWTRKLKKVLRLESK